MVPQLKPLGMKNSNFSITEMQKTPNYAKPYKIDYKKEEFHITQCDFVVNDAATGAGCINASIDDMGKWLAFHLGNGKFGNKQLVSPENLRMTHNPVIIESAEGLLGAYIPGQKWIRMQTMALGWGGQMYRGYRLVLHGGSIDGSISRMAFSPDEGIGVMTIANQSFSYLPVATSFYLIDSLLGLEPVDWNDVIKPIEDNQTKMIKESGEMSQEFRKTDTQPTHDLQEYVGKYYHPGYGNFVFYIENGALNARLGTINYPLTHYHYDTFQFEETRFDYKELLTFQTDSNGDIIAFSIKVEDTLPPILFKRLPDEHLKDKKFLQTLTGKYDVAGQILEIVLQRDDTIMVVSPGQSPIELEGVRDMRFKTKNSDSFSITFKKDESGEISEFIYSGMGSVIPAKRIS